METDGPHPLFILLSVWSDNTLCVCDVLFFLKKYFVFHNKIFISCLKGCWKAYVSTYIASGYWYFMR